MNSKGFPHGAGRLRCPGRCSHGLLRAVTRGRGGVFSDDSKMNRYGQPGIPRGNEQRGIRSMDDLRERCDVDPVTRCWIWRGCVDETGYPRIPAFDPAAGEKRSMAGARAAWCIAHGEAPLPGYYVYRSCGNRRCLNPVHLRQVRDRKEAGRLIAARGSQKGLRSYEATIAAASKGWVKQGITVTSPEIVRAIRAAPPDVTGRALARMHGVSEQRVSAIRNGRSHRWIDGVANGEIN
jgi:hypothetical protein